MHRISLRGPWNLALIDEQLEASRRFHAPRGFFDEQTHQESSDDPRKGRLSLCFLWQTASDWPIDRVRFNEIPILSETRRAKNELGREFFSWDSKASVGRTELNGILRPFNEIVLVWQRWPSEWQAKTGRYTPDPSHPIHIDSWLEIQT